mmetsp:Transcript_28199/g.65577  ORF Transcript_28199/g.65577 Transcript_28199/m.65577 type:complete len:226 (-) Transcript_28199:384-1061(-)
MIHTLLPFSNVFNIGGRVAVGSISLSLIFDKGALIHGTALAPSVHALSVSRSIVEIALILASVFATRIAAATGRRPRLDDPFEFSIGPVGLSQSVEISAVDIAVGIQTSALGPVTLIPISRVFQKVIVIHVDHLSVFSVRYQGLVVVQRNVGQGWWGRVGVVHGTDGRHHHHYVVVVVLGLFQNDGPIVHSVIAIGILQGDIFHHARWNAVASRHNVRRTSGRGG